MQMIWGVESLISGWCRQQTHAQRPESGQRRESWDQGQGYDRYQEPPRYPAGQQGAPRIASVESLRRDAIWCGLVAYWCVDPTKHTLEWGQQWL